MATNRRGSRAELEVGELPALLWQAALSFKASLSLFLTLALLLSAFKAGVRSGLTSDAVLRWRQRLSNSSHTLPHAAAGLQKPGRTDIAYPDPPGGDIPRHHVDERGALDASVELVHEQLEEKDRVLVDDVEYAEEHDMFDMEDTDASSGLPLLRIVMVSNKTGKSAQENVENGLSHFLRDLWGEQRVDDQDAMDTDGMASLVIVLVTAAMLTLLFVVVEFPHAMLLGLVAYSVVSTHMGKRASRRRAACAGLRAGIKRLIWLSFLHATWQVLQARILKETLFRGILEKEQVEQLCGRLSTLPFSILAPLRDEIATDFPIAVRIGAFFGLNQVCASMTHCIYVVACWILVMERDQKVSAAIQRSCHLIRGMILQALVIQLLKAVMCGFTFPWLLQQAMGQFCADFVMSVTKLYFLVLWFIFYMSARSVKDRPSHFSYSTLEDFLEQFK